MDNLNKLLKYLLPNEEINKIVNEADVSREVVEKVCVDIFDKLIPNDFNRQDSGHIDKKDLNGISNNFNNLLTNDNLKALINEISEKYGVEKANTAILVKKILVNVRSKLQYMIAVKKEPVKQKEVPVQKRNEQHVEEPIKKETKAEEINKEEDNDEMTKSEKIALYVVVTCLLIVIALVIFILVKTLR